MIGVAHIIEVGILGNGGYPYMKIKGRKVDRHNVAIVHALYDILRGQNSLRVCRGKGRTRAEQYQ